MRGFRIYPHAQCKTCSTPVGFRGQSPAYSGTDGHTYCERDVDQSWKAVVDSAIAQGQHRDAVEKRKALRSRTAFLAVTRKRKAGEK